MALMAILRYGSKNAVYGCIQYVQNTANISGQEYWEAMSDISENYLYDQDNVRLRELSIGYDFFDNVELFDSKPNYIISKFKSYHEINLGLLEDAKSR